MKRVVLVTGATGFIGANLARALVKRGDSVHVIARINSSGIWRLTDLISQISVHDIDISDVLAVESLLNTVQPEQVYHLAHYGGNRGQDDQRLVRKVIIDGTAAVFEACAKTPSVKIVVNAGSSSEYGSKNDAFSEEMCLNPDTGYGAAKAWATLYGQHLAREKKVPITTLRLFSVYGPYEASTRLVPASILAFLNGGLPNLSSPHTTRDFIYIDDVVAAMLMVADKSIVGEVINIGTGREITLHDIVSKIQEEIGSSVILEWGNIPGRSFDGIKWQANIEHTQNVLGWQPEITLAEGIKRTVEWFRDNKNLYAFNPRT